MKNLWQEETRRETLQRVGTIRESTLPRWGRMSAGAMLDHLAQSLRMGLGDLPTKPRFWPLHFFPLKHLALYVLPMPKSAPTLPELLQRSNEPCDRTAREIERLLGEFAARDPQGQWPAHPAFGRLDGKQWGALTWKHFDHHLRQFGA